MVERLLQPAYLAILITVVLPYNPTLSAHRHTADTGQAKASALKASFKPAFDHHAV